MNWRMDEALEFLALTEVCIGVSHLIRCIVGAYISWAVKLALLSSKLSSSGKDVLVLLYDANWCTLALCV